MYVAQGLGLTTTRHRRIEMGLRELRRQRGLTIEQIAVLADVSTATISRAERGLQNLSPYSVVKISKALRVSPRRIVEEE